MSGLVLKAVEGLIAQWALVGARELVRVLGGLAGKRTLGLQLIERTKPRSFHGIAGHHGVVLIGVE